MANYLAIESYKACKVEPVKTFKVLIKARHLKWPGVAINLKVIPSLKRLVVSGHYVTHQKSCATLKPTDFTESNQRETAMVGVSLISFMAFKSLASKGPHHIPKQNQGRNYCHQRLSFEQVWKV